MAHVIARRKAKPLASLPPPPPPPPPLEQSKAVFGGPREVRRPQSRSATKGEGSDEEPFYEQEEQEEQEWEEEEQEEQECEEEEQEEELQHDEQEHQEPVTVSRTASGASNCKSNRIRTASNGKSTAQENWQPLSCAVKPKPSVAPAPLLCQMKIWPHVGTTER